MGTTALYRGCAGECSGRVLRWNFRMFLFSFTIFTSAFLLFLVQPLIGRIILPWFGGTAAVWTTCLMFFQTTLLLGYLYAHATVRFLTPRRQAILHGALLAVSLAALPILPGAQWKPVDGARPVREIMGLLAVSIGVPYLLLSTTGPLVQSWFARAYPERSPYRLYALSNAGSLLALIAYPAWIEPALRLRFQAYSWSAAYGLFVVMCALSALAVMRQSRVVAATAGDDETGPGWRAYVLWAALAFCPSAMLAAFTSHLTQNIAPIPLLWILPLGAYLLSFILTFDSERWYSRHVWFPLFVCSVAILLAFLFPSARNASTIVLVPVVVGCFFICAVTCHGELYRLRPAPGRLTAFYLMVSLGGALGGVFVTLIAPVVFEGYFEAPVALLGCVVLMGIVLRRERPSLPGPTGRVVEWVLLASLAGGFVYLLGFDIPRWTRENLVMKRNFYGVLRVQDTGVSEDSEGTRELFHGSITHGSEYLATDLRLTPTTYYGPNSGVGLAIAKAHSNPGRRIGVIGLGAGTIAAYGRPGDLIRFYEINPAVVEIARDRFYYVRESRASIDLVLGDARLSLEREHPSNYDVLAVDAFAGDSIPVHLLTEEAVNEYFRHVKPSGIVAIHVSNKYLDLPRVVTAIANHLRKPALKIEDPAIESGVDKSDWILLANSPDVFACPDWNVRDKADLPASGLQLWTDDYSNMMTIVRFK